MPVSNCEAANGVLLGNPPLLSLQDAELVANSGTSTVVDMDFPEWMDWNEFVRSAQTLNGTASASDDNHGHLGAFGRGRSLLTPGAMRVDTYQSAPLATFASYETATSPLQYHKQILFCINPYVRLVVPLLCSHHHGALRRFIRGLTPFHGYKEWSICPSQPPNFQSAACQTY